MRAAGQITGWLRPVRTGLIAAVLAAPLAAGAKTPDRVVSMNLCTDQLAMLLAAPDQLISVSHLARDRRSSAMAEIAESYPINHGRAEEVFVLAPDLVVTGVFSAAAASGMLERLGIRVERFAPAASLDDVRANVARMGALLGREAAAAAMLDQFDADLARLRDEVARRPRAALYAPNGYSSGDRTLAGEILAAAGFANIAAEIGYATGGIVPMEVLVMTRPDLVVTSERFPAASRAEELFDHPALDALPGGTAPRASHDWVCGTPFVLRAVAELAEARQALEGR